MEKTNDFTTLFFDTPKTLYKCVLATLSIVDMINEINTFLSQISPVQRSGILCEDALGITAFVTFIF